MKKVFDPMIHELGCDFYEKGMPKLEKSYWEWLRDKNMALNLGAEKGSAHYKTKGGLELWDLFVSAGLASDSALTSIMRYAFRCRPQVYRPKDLILKDLDKIIDYAEKLKKVIQKEV